jgi:hypothetical protein
MSSISRSDNINIIPQCRLSVNSLSPTPKTKEYLQDCYGVSWDKKDDKNKDKQRESISMSPPSINTAKIINSFIGAKVFKQSISETDCLNTLSKNNY